MRLTGGFLPKLGLPVPKLGLYGTFYIVSVWFASFRCGLRRFGTVVWSCGRAILRRGSRSSRYVWCLAESADGDSGAHLSVVRLLHSCLPFTMPNPGDLHPPPLSCSSHLSQPLQGPSKAPGACNSCARCPAPRSAYRRVHGGIRQAPWFLACRPRP